jgi:hypothetical protein
MVALESQLTITGESGAILVQVGGPKDESEFILAGVTQGGVHARLHVEIGGNRLGGEG